MMRAARRITGARSALQSALLNIALTVTCANVRKLRETPYPARTLYICMATTSTAAAQWRKVTTTVV
jgi:hypothetical protein